MSVSVFFDGHMLGTQTSLRIEYSDEGAVESAAVTDAPTQHDYVFSDRTTRRYKNLSTLLTLGYENIQSTPPPAIVASCRAVYKDATIPWSKAMPKTMHKTFCKNVVAAVGSTIGRLPIEYFEGTWVPGNSILKQLKQPKFEPTGLSDDDAAHVRQQSFTLNDDGELEKTVYNRLGTATGRLTVTSGPNILGLKRELRKFLKPSMSDSSLVYVDFKSLETRILQYVAGGDYVDDIYEPIAKMLNVERSVAKQAIIAEVYGGGKSLLASTLGISSRDKSLSHLSGLLRKKFGIDELLSKLKAEYSLTCTEHYGIIKNVYGRPLKITEPIDRIFINYFAQSTGVDVALLGFSELIQRCKDDDIVVEPNYVLHDALFISVKNEHLNRFIERNSSIKVKGFNHAFPLSFSVSSFEK